MRGGMMGGGGDPRDRRMGGGAPHMQQMGGGGPMDNRMGGRNMGQSDGQRNMGPGGGGQGGNSGRPGGMGDRNMGTAGGAGGGGPAGRPQQQAMGGAAGQQQAHATKPEKEEPAKPKLTVDQMEKRIASTLQEYVEIKDITEVLETLKELPSKECYSSIIYQSIELCCNKLSYQSSLVSPLLISTQHAVTALFSNAIFPPLSFSTQYAVTRVVSIAIFTGQCVCSIQ